jgi:hypothetical protein
MRAFFEKKILIVLLAVLALGALTVLATSLDDVSFNGAQRFGQREAADFPQFSLGDMTNPGVEIPVWKLLLLWGLILMLVILISLLLTREMRKRLLLIIFRTALTLYAFYYVLTHYADRLPMFETAEEAAAVMGAVTSNEPLPEFVPPQITPMFAYIISFVFALLSIAILWGLYRLWKKYAGLNTGKPLTEIGRIVRSSLNDLSAGRDSSDVIINCYLRMSDVVADKQKLHRDAAMTPHEFAVRLERAGLPGDAVRRLTRLFEVVRYGDRKSAPKDVSEAVSCLNTILHYCGETI